MKYLPLLALCACTTPMSMAHALELFDEFEKDLFLQTIETRIQTELPPTNHQAKAQSQTIQASTESLAVSLMPSIDINSMVLGQIQKAKSALKSDEETISALQSATSPKQEVNIDDDAYNQGLLNSQKATAKPNNIIDHYQQVAKQDSTRFMLSLDERQQLKTQMTGISFVTDPQFIQKSRSIKEALKALTQFKFLISDYPPLNLMDKDKQAQSFFIDLIKQIHAQYQQPIDTEQFEQVPLSRAFYLMQGIQKNILLGLAKTKSTTNKYKWVGPVGYNQISLYTLEDRSLSKALETANIGVIRESAARDLLLEQGFYRYRLQPSLTMDSLVKKLDTKRIDAIAISTQSDTVEKIEKSYQIKLKEIKKIGNVPVYFAMSEMTDEAVVQGLQQMIESIDINAM